MGRTLGRRIALDNAAGHNRRAIEQGWYVRPWWIVCSEIDVDALRREVTRDSFAKRRMERLFYYGREGRGLTAAQRNLIRARVSDEQLKRYHRARKMRDL